MRRQVLWKCFLVLILLLSFNQISSSQSENHQTVSIDPSKFFPDSAPESNHETDLSRGNLSLPSTEGAPILESEDQSLSSDQYANDTAPEHVEEPNFFSGELYSPPSFPESQDSKSELDPESNGSDSQAKTQAAAQATDFALPEMEAVSAEPDAINNSETASAAPVSSIVSLPEEYSFQMKAPEPAPPANFPLPETETKVVSDKPEVDDYKSQIKSLAPAPSTDMEVTLSETNFSSADDDSPPVEASASASAPSASIALPEEDVASPTLLPSISPDNYTADNQGPQTIVDDYNNIPTRETESAVPSKNSIIPKTDTESAQESSQAVDIDEGVVMRPTDSNPSVFPSNYSAEDTIDIVNEEDSGSWGSWDDRNDVVVGGVVIGVCLLSLAGIMYNHNKDKKKTRFQYQPLYKGV